MQTFTPSSPRIRRTVPIALVSAGLLLTSCGLPPVERDTQIAAVADIATTTTVRVTQTSVSTTTVTLAPVTETMYIIPDPFTETVTVTPEPVTETVTEVPAPVTETIHAEPVVETVVETVHAEPVVETVVVTETIQAAAFEAPAPAPAAAYYQNCTAARAAGVAPIYQGEPGYGRHLDRDGDGIACE